MFGRRLAVRRRDALAGRRAQEPITILNSPDAPFRISVESEDEDISRLNEEQPVTVSISPQIGEVSSVVSLRASVSFDAPRALLVFDCHRLAGSLQDECPVIVTLPSRAPDGPAKLTLGFAQTALRVGQLLDLQRASELSTKGELDVQLQVHGAGALGITQYSPENPFQIPFVVPIESLAALAEIDREMPIPYFTARGLPERLIEALPENRGPEFEAVKAAVAQHKPSVTSITLRFATANGQDFREEVLGCLPIGTHFSAPRITSGPMPQEELDRVWAAGEEHWKISLFFREDIHDLAGQLREWMCDTTQPFPFQSDNELQFHYCRTRLEREHLRHINRFWYVERPVVFRFCPVTEAEQYRVEMEYWRKKGDERRAELLRELVQEAERRTEALAAALQRQP